MESSVLTLSAKTCWQTCSKSLKPPDETRGRCHTCAKYPLCICDHMLMDAPPPTSHPNSLTFAWQPFIFPRKWTYKTSQGDTITLPALSDIWRSSLPAPSLQQMWCRQRAGLVTCLRDCSSNLTLDDCCMNLYKPLNHPSAVFHPSLLFHCILFIELQQSLIMA